MVQRPCKNTQVSWTGNRNGEHTSGCQGSGRRWGRVGRKWMRLKDKIGDPHDGNLQSLDGVSIKILVVASYRNFVRGSLGTIRWGTQKDLSALFYRSAHRSTITQECKVQVKTHTGLVSIPVRVYLFPWAAFAEVRFLPQIVLTLLGPLKTHYQIAFKRRACTFAWPCIFWWCRL